MSLFTVAGVSINKGKVKVRFCSDMVLRIKNLQKQGDTDIQLIELPNPMNKVEICNFLLERPDFEKYSADIQEILGKKKPAQKTVVNVPAPVTEVEVDTEMEALRELAEA